MRLLVMPRFIGVASFHGGNDMHQSGLIATLLDDFGNHVFFANVRLGKPLAISICQHLGHDRLRFLSFDTITLACLVPASPA
jgi:hypothetical protein